MMKHWMLRTMAGIFLICMVLLGSQSGSMVQSQIQNTEKNVQTAGDSQKSQDIVTGDHYNMVLPDGALSSEPGSLTFIKTGSAQEESAESVLFLLGIFLVLVHFRFLLDGRPWAAVRSICMEFQDFSMHQLQILQLWDGKSKGGSLILNY